MKTPLHILIFCTLSLFGVCLPTHILAESSGSEEFDVNGRLERANKLLEYNGISRAAVLYEEVLRHDPVGYPNVAYTLGQIYEHKEEHGKAALFYYSFLATSFDPTAQAQAKEAISRVVQPNWRRLHIKTPQKVSGRITLNDLYVVSNASKDLELLVPPDHYNVSVRFEEHHPESYVVNLIDEPGVTLTPRPEPFVFFGFLQIDITNHESAHITITQEEANAPSGLVPPQHLTGHTRKPLELPEGIYLVEISDPDHERWVRRVHIERDLDSDVRATLSKALPAELRFDEMRQEEMKYIVTRDAMSLIKQASNGASAVSSQVADGSMSRDEAMGTGPKPRVVATY